MATEDEHKNLIMRLREILNSVIKVTGASNADPLMLKLERKLRMSSRGLVYLLDEALLYSGEYEEELRESIFLLTEIFTEEITLLTKYAAVKPLSNRENSLLLFTVILKEKSLLRDINNILIPYRENKKISEYVKIKILVEKLSKGL